MKKYMLTALTALSLVLSSCHEIEEYPNTTVGNFEQLWQLFDEHYCFFREKGVDWDAVHDKYAPRAAACQSERELFSVCSDMIGELRDGHVNLSSWFDTYYYRAWWSDYPQNYDARIVRENYLYFKYDQVGSVSFAILPDNIGYVRIPSFESGLGESNMDAILSKMRLCHGIIIDVRDNGGGAMTNAETIARRFMTKKTLAYSIMHKNGKGHDDFSKPYDVYFAPPKGHLSWSRPVALLTNRSTFSAANVFTAVMKQLPNVTVIGAKTGGGGGMPLSFEIRDGWGVRMSAAPILDANGVCTENGIEPTEGFAVDITPADIAAGRDPILDTAINLLLK